MLAAPLVVVAAGGLAACGRATGTIVLGAPTTTQAQQCPPLMGITNCTTTTVDATSTSYFGITPTTVIVLGLSTTTYLGLHGSTEPPVTDPPVVPEATLPKTK